MKNTKIPLTAVIMAKNEAHQIARALESLDFCDEILIFLDSEAGEEETIRIAGEFGAKILIKSLENEGLRRAFAANHAKNNWVLECDADESISPELALEICQKLPKAQKGYFLIPFDNHIGARRVRHGWGAIIGTAAKACLFHKECKSWGGESQHPKVSLLGKKQKLNNRINHYIDDDIHDLWARLNRYSTKRAQDMLYAPKIDSFPMVFWRFICRFLKLYLIRGGYKEGVYGFVVALAGGLYPMLSLIKYYELRDKAKLNKTSNQ